MKYHIRAGIGTVIVCAIAIIVGKLTGHAPNDRGDVYATMVVAAILYYILYGIFKQNDQGE